MNQLSGQTREYLLELYNQTQGNIDEQVSMHEVGIAIGMEKNEAGDFAQELIVDGLVDLKTLAGGVSLTAQGVELLAQEGIIQISSNSRLKLSGGNIAEEADLHVIDEILKQLKEEITQNRNKYTDIEEMIIDIKTLEVQLLSSSPKMAIIKEVLKSIHAAAEKMKLSGCCSTLAEVIQ